MSMDLTCAYNSSHIMRKLSLLGIFLQPSVGSTILILLTGLLIFGSTLVSFGGANDTMYRLLLGEESTLEFVDLTKSTFANMHERALNNPVVNRVVFFSFWFFTGLVAYLIITSVASGVGAANALREEKGLVNSRKNILFQELITRIIVRLAVLLIWFVYAVFFLKLFLPFSVLCFKIATNGAWSMENIGIGLLGTIVLIITLHIHVILLRGLLLKPRIFGGSDDLLAAHLT